MFNSTSVIMNKNTPATKRALRIKNFNLRAGSTTLLFAACLAFGLVATPSMAAERGSHLRISQSEMGRTQRVDVGQNKSIIVDLPAEVGEVIVSQPNVATAIMRSKRRAIVQGVNDGETNIFFLDSLGRSISVLELAVKSPPSRVAKKLEDTISRVIPGSRIKVESVILEGNNREINRVVLSGTALSADDITKATSIAIQFAGDEKNVASVVSVEGSQQVMLKVTVAEVSREVVKQLGINLSGSFNPGNLVTSVLNNNTLGGASGLINSNGITAGVNVGALQMQATLKALERRGAVRTLAEPTLTAISGTEAHFLAGGNFPVPSGISDGVLTFDFRDFGIDLTFTPTVMTKGQIGLAIETKVSEPTTEGGLTVGGVTIPATRDREAKTSVQMQSGTTLAIAGLFEDKVRQQINELPGISKLPILGALFRSRDFIHSQTELLVLVTPILASTDPVPSLPTNNLTFASDAETIFLGRMETLYGVGQGNGGNIQGYKGSIGFVLD